MNLLYPLLVIFSLSACAPQMESHVSALEGETVKSYAFAAGIWRMMARYDYKVEGSNGAYSGLTAVIAVGDNSVSHYEGERVCDLEVRSKDSDYRALDLPGGDGTLMNPCSIVASTTNMFPFNGSKEVTGNHPAGGTMTVYYDDSGNFGGYSATADGMGHIILSINNIAPLPGGTRTGN